MYLKACIFLSFIALSTNSLAQTDPSKLTFLERARNAVVGHLREHDELGAVIKFYAIYLNPEVYSSDARYLSPANKLDFQVRFMSATVNDSLWPSLDKNNQTGILAVSLEQEFTALRYERFIIEQLAAIGTTHSMAVLWELTGKSKKYLDIDVSEALKPAVKGWRRFFGARLPRTGDNFALAQKLITRWSSEAKHIEMIFAELATPIEEDFVNALLSETLWSSRSRVFSCEDLFL